MDRICVSTASQLCEGTSLPKAGVRFGPSPSMRSSLGVPHSVTASNTSDNHGGRGPYRLAHRHLPCPHPALALWAPGIHPHGPGPSPRQIVEPLLSVEQPLDKSLAVLITSERDESDPTKEWVKYAAARAGGKATPWDLNVRAFRSWVENVARRSGKRGPNFQSLVDCPVLSPYILNYLARQAMPVPQDAQVCG